jgi:two-component system OmpR family sensor kinase
VSRRRPASRIREAAAATPLRIQLVATVLMLTALGLALAAFATTASLHSYLLGRVDEQLRAAANSPVGAGYFHDRSGAPDRGDGDRPPLPSQYYVAQYLPDGAEYGAPQQASLQSQSPPKLPTLTTQRAEQLSAQPFTVSSVDGKATWRVISRVRQDGTGSVAIATSLADTSRTIRHVIYVESGIGAVVLVAIGLAGYLLIRRSLRPLVSVEHTAAAIAAGDLTQRVPQLPTRTEVGRLSVALNGMLAQVERSFDHERRSQRQATASEARMRRFVADASHELRTPLTSIRGFAELYRMGAAGQARDLPRLMGRIEDEATRMGVLVDDLLLLARLDQQRPLATEPVDLLAVVNDTVHDAQTTAPHRDVSLSVETSRPPIVTGDEPRLRQVVANLIGNALVHTPDGSPIEVALRLEDADSTVVLTVADRGEGIDPSTASRLFERFYRADSSRSRAAGGSGLGLSIVAGLVAAHRGTVAADRRAGGGAVFTVTLPMAD